MTTMWTPGAEFNNTLPPRLPLLALGFLQAGVLLTLEPPIRARLAQGGLSAATVLVNSLTMTLYLWHMTAMITVLVGDASGVNREFLMLPFAGAAVGRLVAVPTRPR